MANLMTLTLEDKWTRENLAWAAGFLEGEGCFSCSKRKYKNRPNKEYYYISIQAGQNIRSKDCLVKLQNILGGNITGPYNNKQNKKKQDEMITWTISSQHLAYAVCVALFPFMCLRRQTKIIELIEAFKLNKNKRKK